MAIKIERVEPGSEAEALGLVPGDELLAVDENELNDTKETATPLPIGTDAAFSIGGINDEDWFSFEAVPEE